MNLSEDQILALAPDEPSKKSGKDLANPSKWVTKGMNDKALWGECQGSGSKPYQTQIDINNIAFKCSCPSRKFPCKHGLGLLLLHARQPALFGTGEPPSWVTEWLDKREQKQEKQTEKTDKPVDEAAQAKRQQARQTKVSDGIEELTAWLKDIIRNGIVGIPDKGTAFFENISRRMIDAQAPGLAGMVRLLSETDFYTEGWQSKFMEQVVKIYLVISGYRNATAVPEELQQDLRAFIGFTQSQEELKEQTGVLDTWLVLGKQSSETDGIVTERFWLFGTKTNRYAVVLQFIVRGQGLQFNFTAGMFVEAELVFFPSAAPLRALIKRQITTSAVNSIQKFNTWHSVLEEETRLNSLLPFRSERPYLVSNLTLARYNEQWWLRDNEGYMMAVKDHYPNIWDLLAVSGMQPHDMAVVSNGVQYEPLGIWLNEQYKMI
ncbi:SWIM zinc finger family protein [Terrimonas sp. NA20]|uniref:SWIM zinc finger family protein n=1 Tax=Terrimonas ginsenosidimutans TaxID=2908004 RepID=A0ABS9KN61_9BACT|nr:SWIM zinc finger family protein [Terrimonas ginsenosidimutans]MCG2613775.1 SWIM zinc finger family protein [Terrimonas ginsenosidimutans]